jgi:hypothetical protein
VCAVVAPTLFAALDVRTASTLAGRFFLIASWLSFAFASATASFIHLHERRVPRAEALLILATAGGPLLNEWFFRPGMEAARVAGDTARFGMYHGISMVLFGVACITALLLAWRLANPAVSRPAE